jgi:hypothetical protein
MRIFRKEPQQGTNADGKQDLLRHQYEQICQSYYKIEEFRGRLLVLWPILGAAAGGIALLASGKLVDYLLPLGIFGFAVSVGVGIHEWTQPGSTEASAKLDSISAVSRPFEAGWRFTQWVQGPRAREGI